MQELSLNILDIAQNSIVAQASLIEIKIAYRHLPTDGTRIMTVQIADNGSGMSEQVAQNVTNPFYTTRTTRKVGLGTSFFRMAAEMCDGSFELQSAQGEGTTVKIELNPDHIDALPLGDIAATYTSLLITEPQRDYLLCMSTESPAASGEFCADTRVFKQVLGEDVPINSPQVLLFITDYINENMTELFGQGYKF